MRGDQSSGREEATPAGDAAVGHQPEVQWRVAAFANSTLNFRASQPSNVRNKVTRWDRAL